MMSITVRSNGTPLHGLARVEPPTFSTSEHGPLAASWSMGLPVGYTHPALQQGARVELYAGTWRIWAGVMSEPDRSSWEIAADGLHRLGERFKTLVRNNDGTYRNALTVDDAIQGAIARGLPWRLPVSISAEQLTTDVDAATEVTTISNLLDTWCETRGKAWHVDAWGNVTAYTLPTAPTHALRPGTPTFATAEDDYRARVFLRHVSQAPLDPNDTEERAVTKIIERLNAAAQARWGAAEEFYDYTDKGFLETVSSGQLAEALLANDSSRLAPTQRLEVSRAQLTNLGGVSPDLWAVQAGRTRIRQLGNLALDGSINFGRATEWTLAGTEYTAGSRSIVLTPRGLLPRTQADVIAAAVVDRFTPRPFKKVTT